MISKIEGGIDICELRGGDIASGLGRRFRHGAFAWGVISKGGFTGVITNKQYSELSVLQKDRYIYLGRKGDFYYSPTGRGGKLKRTKITED